MCLVDAKKVEKDRDGLGVQELAPVFAEASLLAGLTDPSLASQQVPDLP